MWVKGKGSEVISQPQEGDTFLKFFWKEAQETFLLPFQLTHFRVDYDFKLHDVIICNIYIVLLSLSKYFVNIC